MKTLDLLLLQKFKDPKTKKNPEKRRSKEQQIKQMQGNRVTKEQKKVTALAMDFSWTTMES